MDESRRKHLAGYVQAIKSGESIDETARIFGSTAELDGKLNGHGQWRTLPSVPVAISDVPIQPVQVRSPSADETAIMPTLILSNAGVDKAAGYGRVTASAYLEIADDPKLVHALVYRGIAEQALALDPAAKTDAAVPTWYLEADRADIAAGRL